MVSLRTLCSHYSLTLLKHQNPSQFVKNASSSSSLRRFSFSEVQDFLFTNTLIFQRKFSASAQLVSANGIEDRTEGEWTDSDNNGSTNALEKKGKMDLDATVKGFFGLSQKIEENGSSEEELKEGKLSIGSSMRKIKELKKKLHLLEREVRSMKGNVESTEKNEGKLEREEKNMKGRVERTKGKTKKKEKENVSKTKQGTPSTIQSKPNSLYTLFASKQFNSKPKEAVALKQEKQSSDIKRSHMPKQDRVSSIVRSKPLKENRTIQKQLSLEMVSLVSRWHEEGYLNDEKVSKTNESDVSFNFSHYPRDFLRFTAEKFGQDHQEIAKWLSGSDLKKVALFGCPSLEKKSAFAAKRLRSFFRIQEDVVCHSCKLKNTCKLVNQRVWEGTDHLNLADVMRVLASYELDLVAMQLEIPNEVKVSTGKLLKEVANLSQ